MKIMKFFIKKWLIYYLLNTTHYVICMIYYVDADSQEDTPPLLDYKIKEQED